MDNAKPPIYSDSDLCTTSLIATSTFCEEYYISTTMLGSNPPILQLRMVTSQKRNPVGVATMHHSLATGGEPAPTPTPTYPSPGGSTDFGADSGPDSFAASVVVARRLPRLDRLRASTDNNSLPPDFLPSSRNPSLSPLFPLSSSCLHSLFEQ